MEIKISFFFIFLIQLHLYFKSMPEIQQPNIVFFKNIEFEFSGRRVLNTFHGIYFLSSFFHIILWVNCNQYYVENIFFYPGLEMRSNA